MKLKKEKKKITLTRYLGVSYGVFATIGGIMLITLLALGTIYIVNRSNTILTVLAIIIPVAIVSILVSVIIIMRSSYNVFYKNLYSTTLRNYENLKEDKKQLTKYEGQNIIEFEELNNSLNELSIHNANSQTRAASNSYDKIPLEYFDKRNRLVNEKSFKKYIRDIIYSTESFRNVVISVLYDSGCDLDSSTIKTILFEINKIFKNTGTLVSIKDNKLGLYIYAPKIESISFLREILDIFLQRLTITKKTISGIQLVPPKINAVIYPYSTIEDIFADLEFAERGGHDINIYIPEHFNNVFNQSLLHSSMNLNNVSKLITNVSSLKEGEGDFDEFLNNVGKVFKELLAYFSLEQGGLLLYDRERKKTGGSVSVTINDKIKPLFNKQSAVKQDLIDTIIASCDDDGSYYFSDRSNVTINLGRQLDIYGIKSGFLYRIVNPTNTFVGVIYFVNTINDKFLINSYMQEALLVISNMIGVYVKNALKHQEINEMRNREYNILKMTNIRSYTIDKDTFEIVNYSPSIKEDFPQLEIGQVCYKTLFGYDKPCAHCPLIYKQKSVKDFKDKQFEVSYSINTKMSNYIELILNKVENKDITHNRFDPDLLINTYYSFTQRLENLYLSKAKGYIVLLKIDNIETLIENLGNEGYSFLVRCFARDVNEKLLKDSELYLYKSNTLAIIFSEIGKLDVVDNVEKVYEYSKMNHSSNGLTLSMTYEAVKFPQEHSNYDDMIRHLEIVSRQFEVEGEDMFYIEENEFIRPASRENYILSIINQATINRNFIIKSQPVVRSENKSIFGAEILIRLSDEYRSSLLNTEEMIEVAAKNDKLSVISDMLIDYVGNLVQTYGNAIFKANDFIRMSINADFNYFKEESFRNKIVASVNKYKMPKNFLTFEITEKDFAIHYQEMLPVIKQLHENDINVVVDHYTGENLSFERVKALGCNEIKVDRKIVSDIDVNSDKLESIKLLMLSAKEQGIKLTLVGVENGAQYNLIREIDSTCSLQGYYFHHPLDQNALIEAIRLNGQKNNID